LFLWNLVNQTMAREISAVTGKPKVVRREVGKLEAIKAAKMTKEQWAKWQADKYQKAWPRPTYMQEKKQFVHVRDGGEGAYRDQTYEIVTRWTEKTKIQYRPHAKAPGSKSHVRYEKYAKATTVGEALKLGSWPIDWCYDYEHGFIKVLGGTIRDEPIDQSQVDDMKKLTETDKVLLAWYKRELAKKFGLKVQDLHVPGGHGESLLIRAHRMVANRRATEYLEAAEKANQAVSEARVEEVLGLWGFARNPNRQNVFPDGRDWVWSDNIGLVRDRQGSIHLTSTTTRYPSVIKMLCTWLTARLPSEAADFTFTSLNLNCNYAARRHRDGNNLGPSMIKAFGPFEGGELSCFPSDDKSVELEKLPEDDRVRCNIKSHLCMFNGNSAHEVSDFTGKRFSVVYFTASCHARASEEDKAKLKELGVPFPSADADPHALLQAPDGYKKKQQRSKGTVPKQLRLWPVASLSTRLRKRGQATPTKAGKKVAQSTPPKAAAVKKATLKRSPQKKK